MTRSEHIPALDGIRGLAVILVIFSHFDRIGFTAQAPTLLGASGVMLFFTLSGFLMGLLYLNQPFSGDAVIGYATARAGRILPLFYLVILCSYAVSALIGPDYIYFLDGHDTLRHIFFVGSKHVFWSIPPEVEFYVVFVFLWWATSSGFLRSNLLPIGLVLAFILLIRPAFPGIVVFSHIHIFMLGVCASVLRPWMQPDQKSLTVVQVFCIACLALIALGLPSRTFLASVGWQSNSVVYGSIPVALMFSVIVLGFSYETIFGKLLFGNSLMRRIGSYSFSIYLLHEPVMLGVRKAIEHLGAPQPIQMAASFVAIFLTGALSFHFFERPMQRLVKKGAARARINLPSRTMSVDNRIT